MIPILFVESEEAENLVLGKALIFTAQKIAAHLLHEKTAVAFLKAIEVLIEYTIDLCGQGRVLGIGTPHPGLLKCQPEIERRAV